MLWIEGHMDNFRNEVKLNVTLTKIIERKLIYICFAMKHCHVDTRGLHYQHQDTVPKELANYCNDLLKTLPSTKKNRTFKRRETHGRLAMHLMQNEFLRLAKFQDMV